MTDLSAFDQTNKLADLLIGTQRDAVWPLFCHDAECVQSAMTCRWELRREWRFKTG